MSSMCIVVDDAVPQQGVSKLVLFVVPKRSMTVEITTLHPSTRYQGYFLLSIAATMVLYSSVAAFRDTVVWM